MSSNKKLRGVALLSIVFGELVRQLPEGEISTEELLQAAQKLIQLSKREYVTNSHPDPRQHHGYYSCNLCTAFEKFQGRILENEMRALNESDDPLASKMTSAKLKEVMLGCRGDAVLEDVYG